MCIEYLREVAKQKLPITVEGESQIDQVRVLRAAGLVTAMFLKPGVGFEVASVLTITPKGRKVLASSTQLSV